MNASDIYRTFTGFKPDQNIGAPLLWPEQNDLCLLGWCIGISYRSDKWTGETVDYIHPGTTSVVVLAPKIPGYPPSPPPPQAPIGSRFAFLGRNDSYCLELNYINAINGLMDLIDFLTYPILPWIAARDSHTLIICYPNDIPIIVTGPGLEITDRGIVG